MNLLLADLTKEVEAALCVHRMRKEATLSRDLYPKLAAALEQGAALIEELLPKRQTAVSR